MSTVWTGTSSVTIEQCLISADQKRLRITHEREIVRKTFQCTGL